MALYTLLLPTIIYRWNLLLLLKDDDDGVLKRLSTIFQTILKPLFYSTDATESEEDGSRGDRQENQADGSQGRSGQVHRYQDAQASVFGQARSRQNRQEIVLTLMLLYGRFVELFSSCAVYLKYIFDVLDRCLVSVPGLGLLSEVCVLVTTTALTAM